MIIDTRSHSIDTGVVYDVCIIGAGAAGITTALELAANKNIKVAILEAGGEHFNSRVQSLYQGEIEGDNQMPLWRARFSGLGGSTQIWAGWCRPLEAIDFEKREYIPNSGWPIRIDDLDAAYKRANEICGLGSYTYDLTAWQNKLSGTPLLVCPELQHHVFQVKRMRFNQEYFAQLKTAQNIDLFMYCPVMRLHADSGTEVSKVSHVEVASYSGTKSQVKAKQFVLASGGIENARLLLLSGSSPERALGNQNDCVGRYFLDHGFIDSGWFIPSPAKRDLSYYFSVPHPHDQINASIRPVITLAPEVLKTEKLGNSAMYFYPSYESHPVFSSTAVKTALELWEIVKGKSAVELYEIVKTDGALAELWTYCKRIGSHPFQVLHAVQRKMLVRDTDYARWRLRFYYECTPSPDNRVVLCDKKDRFGRAQAKLIWHLNEQDLESAYRFHRYLDDILQKNGTGRLSCIDDLSQWRTDTETGKHPSGTTRMHDDPKQGVVDRDCKVHGVENLYIAGSSVFPTVGYANPTLTLVALAVRLAGELQLKIQ